MICPSCGKESGTESPFCTYCGANMSFAGHALDAEKKRLKDAIDSRRRSDRRIEPWFVAIPLIINIIIGCVVVVAVFSEVFSYDLTEGRPPMDEVYRNLAWAFSFAFAGGAVFYSLFAILTYLLLDRANKHVEAEQGVRAEIVAMLAKMRESSRLPEANDPWRNYDVIPQPDIAWRRRNPILWAFVIMIPVIGSALQLAEVSGGNYDPYGGWSAASIPLTMLQALLVLYLLHMISQDTSRHDSDWVGFATQVRMSFARSGAAAGGLETGNSVPPRPFALYLVLTVITMGLFMFFWWYALIKDANAHYARQAEFESNLLSMLSPTTHRAPVSQA